MIMGLVVTIERTGLKPGHLQIFHENNYSSVYLVTHMYFDFHRKSFKCYVIAINVWQVRLFEKYIVSKGYIICSEIRIYIFMLLFN